MIAYLIIQLLLLAPIVNMRDRSYSTVSDSIVGYCSAASIEQCNFWQCNAVKCSAAQRSAMPTVNVCNLLYECTDEYVSTPSLMASSYSFN